MFEALEPLIQRSMAEWQVPGLAITIVHQGQTVFQSAYGRRDLDTADPVTPETQFLLCSLTKSFTALGLAMLADERRLNWRKPVRDYLPEFRLKDPVASDRVTVLDLLSHQTGLPRHDWVWMPADLSPPEMLAALRHLEPSQDLRQGYQYQNLGYMAAGMVAERITGQTWQEFTRARILIPLGMLDHGFSITDLEQAPGSARPHVYDIDKDHTVRTPLCPITTVPAGGLNASVAAMATYLRFQLGDGTFDGQRLLSPENMRLLRKPLSYISSSEFEEIGEQHYGLGLACYTYRGEPSVAHDGGWVGWGTRMDMLPGHGLGVAVLTNRMGSPLTSMLCHAVFDHVTGKDPVPWFDRYYKRKHDFIAQQPDHKQAHAKARRPGTAPTHPLEEYVGHYQHPAYGTFQIEHQEGALHWHWRGLQGTLSHRHFDIFEIPETTDGLSLGRIDITFAYDRDGAIDRLSAPLEPSVQEIVFRRAPHGEALDAAFRATCVGTYRSGAQMHLVALAPDGTLTLSPSDQPTYRLLPYQGRVFTIEGLEGYRVEFQPDEAGLITTIVFHQPNGTYVARRTETETTGP